MTKHDLKELAAMGAELGAAKAENDRLREVLSRIANLPMYQCSTENDYRLSAAKAMAVAALSQQPEPTDTYTAVDMATAAAQGFRDGQAAVEQAQAQDEREAFEAAWMAQGGTRPGNYSTEYDRYACERVQGRYEGWKLGRATRPAQTEQQLAGWRRVVERLIANVEILDQRPRPICRDCADCNGVCDSGLDCDIRALVEEARAMLAAPIAQTATQGWKLVPVKLTQAMREAFNSSYERYEDGHGECPDSQWSAMLRAAPSLGATHE